MIYQYYVYLLYHYYFDGVVSAVPSILPRKVRGACAKQYQN